MQSDLKHIVSSDIANHYRVIPKGVQGLLVELFMDENQLQEDIKDELELLLGKSVTLTPVSSKEIDKMLSLHYRKERTTVSKSLTINNDFLEQLIYEAKSLKSSDIHFEIYEFDARIRFRIDGQLIELYKVEKENYLELVNKIKIRSKLNITEKRLPQDGRITNDSFDIRVSILPTLFGEKIVMRLLGNDVSSLDLTTIGFENEELKLYQQAIRKPNGIVLISGPTGSGKTTTLYATLKVLNNTIRNIVTVEDPIEYTLKGINQVQLKEEIGLSFATALKSFLRQDPDIIMLGEIRDTETAMMAIRASLTGHLVLSTIHTNSAIGTISRLIDMGIPSYLIAETLNISLAQRLVRKLCNNCKEQTNLAISDFPLGFTIPYEPDRIYKPVGCNNCFHTGYNGRRAIYEVLPINTHAVLSIKNNDLASMNAKNNNFKTLPQKAFDLLASGETSLEEIYSILIHI